MLTRFKSVSIVTLFIALIHTACTTEDPGPIQEIEKDYALTDFDRLEMGSGFDIDVEQSSTYRVEVSGDRRNVDDLDVFKSGSTLIIKYDDNANRKHATRIRIYMPDLQGINFSGGTTSTIEGFESDKSLDFFLSGGSVSQLNAGYRELNLTLSGGSKLHMSGLGDEVDADISGSSELTAFDYPVRQASVSVSGASQVKVTVTDELDATASGASLLLYRGSPSLNSNVSGASNIMKD